MSSLEFSDVRGSVQGLRETCHDMRQPVAGVFALAAAGRAGLPGAARTCLKQIIEPAELLASMIQHWLRATEPGRGCPHPDLLRIANQAALAE